MSIKGKILLWIVYIIFLLLWFSGFNELELLGKVIIFPRWWVWIISFIMCVLTGLPEKRNK